MTEIETKWVEIPVNYINKCRQNKNSESTFYWQFWQRWVKGGITVHSTCVPALYNERLILKHNASIVQNNTAEQILV